MEVNLIIILLFPLNKQINVIEKQQGIPIQNDLRFQEILGNHSGYHWDGLSLKQ